MREVLKFPVIITGTCEGICDDIKIVSLELSSKFLIKSTSRREVDAEETDRKGENKGKALAHCASSFLSVPKTEKFLRNLTFNRCQLSWRELR